MKDKFLNHLTGHLYFGPKCTKHFHRLYHHTRDCTIPACKFYHLRPELLIINSTNSCIIVELKP
uniref:ALK and LTK ligand 2 n=1 Tax=Pseudonaja textilis TaxID=8673 RepID=A0A670YTS5_PSETE